MAILNILNAQTGLVGVLPSLAYIYTSNTESEILVTGFLNHEVQQGFQFSMPCIAAVSTKETPTSQPKVGWYQVAHVGTDWSLVPGGSPGDVTLPTIANHIATYTNTTGTLSEDPATAISGGNIQAGLATGTAGFFASYSSSSGKGALRLTAVANTGDTLTTISNVAMGQASVISIPDPANAIGRLLVGATATPFVSGNFPQNSGTGGLMVDSGVAVSAIATTTTAVLKAPAADQAITAHNLAVTAGSLTSGISTGGFVGLVKAFPTTATKGFVALQAAVNATGDFGTTISNATAQGQAEVITIPDAGAATANFLLDTGAANILAEQQFVGLSNVLAFSVGTWTTTRIATGNYASVKSQADETAIIGIDITPIIRVAASKGFRLDSFDMIYSIATLALDAHSVTLSRVAYANNVAVSVTSVAVTGTLATATQANPYATNVTVDTPAFDITADSKYVIEESVNAGATSDYTFYGVMLKFSQTIA